MRSIKIIFFLILSYNNLLAFQQTNGFQIAKDANKVIGLPYIWGGTDLSHGVDCSALVKLLYSKYGYALPRTANQQIQNTTSCPTITNLQETQVGDALYFKNKQGKIHHVAIISAYTNHGTPIITHAKGKKFGVIKEPLSQRYRKEFIGAKRFYNCTSPLAKHITNEEIAEVILHLSKKYHIEAALIYTLISIESNFEPLVITIETTPKIAEFLTALRELGIRVVTGGQTFHSKKAIVNIYPKDIIMAQYIAQSLKENEYAFDLGLMQIHSTNFSITETENLLYPKNNISKGLTILKHCLALFSEKKDQIECYNRGAGNLKKAQKRGMITYPYYKRFIRSFNKNFK